MEENPSRLKKQDETVNHLRRGDREKLQRAIPTDSNFELVQQKQKTKGWIKTVQTKINGKETESFVETGSVVDLLTRTLEKTLKLLLLPSLTTKN